MFKSKILHSLLVAGFLASGGAANAAVSTYDFGTLALASNGYSAPNSFSSNPFAKLVVDDSYAAGTWRFSLTIQNNLFASFGADAYIQAMGFDYNPDPVVPPTSTFVSSNLGGVSTVWTGNGGQGLGGIYEIDFKTVFGMNSPGRLQQNDNVTWDISGLGASTLAGMYIRTGFVTPGDNRWAKYVTVVPEPETYAMVLAGLGLLGFTARRRRNNA